MHYPKKFSIDEDDKLYGHVKGFNVHLLVGTGKSDWVRDVTDEKGSVMQALGKVGLEVKSGGKRKGGERVMLSASDFPSGEECHGPGEENGTADVMILPSWSVVEKVAPTKAGVLMREVVDQGALIAMPVGGDSNGNGEVFTNGDAHATSNEEEGEGEGTHTQDLQIDGGAEAEGQETATLDPAPIPASISTSFKIRPIPHSYLILMCSQKTRDARCGQSAPLLRKEFERILRPMGLYRDVHDERPGGVGIYFISHVGGHKYSANVMIYRRQGEGSSKVEDEAVQLIWLARVRPEDCENIVKYTILQGKVVKPRRQLRGGFDREKGLTSW